MSGGRPQKQTVDYFPHDAVGGKTLFILNSRFGNNGYATWYKLLALLCRTPGHFYKCDKAADWQFLVAETGLSEGETTTILNCLAELEAIDPELWGKKGIWCQNLVNRLAPVYRERKSALPPRPDIKTVSQEVNLVMPLGNTVNPADNTQSKVKESKVKEITPIVPLFINKGTWDAFLEMRKKKSATPTPKALEILFKKLGEFKDAGEDPNKILEQSIMNNWTGIFPLKSGGQYGKQIDVAKSPTQFSGKYGTVKEHLGADYQDPPDSGAPADAE